MDCFKDWSGGAAITKQTEIDRMHPLAIETSRYTSFKQKLIDTYSDIDEETLEDTLEGLSDLDEIIASAIRSAVADEALASALKARIADMKLRLSRLQSRAKGKRAACAKAMADTGLKSIQKDDLTVSLRSSQLQLDILDEAVVPKNFWRTPPPVLDKRALSDALKAGHSVSGVTVTQSAPSLTVRLK